MKSCLETCLGEGQENLRKGGELFITHFSGHEELILDPIQTRQPCRKFFSAQEAKRMELNQVDLKLARQQNDEGEVFSAKLTVTGDGSSVSTYDLMSLFNGAAAAFNAVLHNAAEEERATMAAQAEQMRLTLVTEAEQTRETLRQAAMAQRSIDDNREYEARETARQKAQLERQTAEYAARLNSNGGNGTNGRNRNDGRRYDRDGNWI